MVRPRKIKWINFEPGITYFKPRAVPLSELEEVEITLDELETLRLSNLENLNQIGAASKMEIHQSTFQRTLTRAREKVTDALVNGKAIKLHGGEYKMPGGDGTGPLGQGPIAGRGRGQGAGRGGRGRNGGPIAGGGRGQGAGRGGRGRNGGPIAGGPGGVCKCPECGHEQAHVRGQPCSQVECPKCKTLMTRK